MGTDLRSLGMLGSIPKELVLLNRIVIVDNLYFFLVLHFREH